LTHSSPISTQPITSVQDMPQTVTVVSGQVMQEQAVTTLDDALKNGRITAGAQSAEAKHNLQVPENSPAHREAGDIILGALGRNELFTSASLAQKVFPPLFNRYDAGMAFGTHIDNAIRFVKTAGPPLRIRTDLSATLFLTEPADYDGGELIILDSFGSHSVKLPAGDLALYSATSRHNVTAVKHGSRVSSFFWIQSMVRDTDARQMLFELDGAIQGLRKTQGDSEEIVTLTGLYHNLLRRWADA
jgi:PKHD-type hydroxylase